MPKSKEPKIPTDRLLKSKALSGYQPDFARAILTESEYTLTEAKKLLAGVVIRKE
jgi:hypothetical protein